MGTNDAMINSGFFYNMYNDHSRVEPIYTANQLGIVAAHDRDLSPP